ncbi:MAG: hypothetical protein KDB80_13310 [Planctomycetes bacterium]|nr:hypothetical protein [Planctomycetota bacterium]
MILAAIQQGTARAIETEESFVFLNLPATWLVWLVLVPGAIAIAWWSYGGITRLEPTTRTVLASLRAVAILLGLLILFQPAFERVRYSKVRTQVHVLVDDSASMQRRDTYPDADQRGALVDASGVEDIESMSRAQLVGKVLDRPGGLLDSLEEDYDVRLFRFERKPLPINSLDELTSRGPRTQIGDALDLHLAAAGSVNLEAVVVVSDGRNNAGLDPVEVAQRYRLVETPILTLGVGDPNPPRNIRLIGPHGPEDALREEEVVFEVTLDPEGLEDREVTVTLHGARDGVPSRPLASQAAVLGPDHAPVKVRLYHAFEEAGDWVLKFAVSELPEETSHEDNTATRFLRVDDEKIRVLYLEGPPRWDYRYLKNALLRVDSAIEAQIFLFSASGTFRQESSPNLPALRDIPRTREELFSYHVILLGDVAPENIAPTEAQLEDWLGMLVEFVEFGGGVGFVFGDHAMPERYRRTTLEDLLPVVLDDPAVVTAETRDRSTPFRARLANPAVPHEITRLLRDDDANRRLWSSQLGEMFVYYPVKQLKPGAISLLEHPTASNRFGPRVLAATAHYPRGNTFFLATDESWRWRHVFGEVHQDRFWRNVVRHLASGRLQRRDDRVALRVNKSTLDTGGQVRVSLEMLDEDYRPTSDGEAVVFLREADGVPIKRVLQAEPGEIGRFRGSFTLDDPGSYSFLVFAGDNPSDEVLAREDVFVQIPDREQADSSQDVATLEQIAAATAGGEYRFLADASELVDALGERRPFENEIDRSLRPIWDSFWSLLGLLVVLGAEWLLRKRARLI